MALPVRSDGQQYYQNLSGYTGEATPESVDIMGANFQKQTEATKAGLAYDRAEKKQGRLERRLARNERKARSQNLSFGRSQRQKRREGRRNPGSDVASGKKRAQTSKGSFAKSFRAGREAKLEEKLRQPIKVGFGKNRQEIDVNAINRDPELQRGYRAAEEQGKAIRQNNLEQGAELGIKVAANLSGTGTIPGILLNAAGSSVDAGFKGEDAGKAFLTEGAKAYLGGDLFDQNMQSLKAAKTIKQAGQHNDVGALLTGLEQAPGAAGEITQGAQQAGLNIAGKKYMPNQIAGMAMQALEGSWQDPMKQLGQGFMQQGTLPTNSFSITNPNVGKPSGPTYQPFDPNSMLTNPFQQPQG